MWIRADGVQPWASDMKITDNWVQDGLYAAADGNHYKVVREFSSHLVVLKQEEQWDVYSGGTFGGITLSGCTVGETDAGGDRYYTCEDSGSTSEECYLAVEVIGPPSTQEEYSWECSEDDFVAFLSAAGDLWIRSDG